MQPVRPRDSIPILLLTLGLCLASCTAGRRGDFSLKDHYSKAEHRIPMRDGAKLFTIVYSPKDTTQTFPILLKRSPYSIAPYGPEEYHQRLGPSEAFDRERYQFLKWGQKAFDNFKVVPPETGIVHQVNLEYLGRVVFSKEANGLRQAFPDTLVGTDSHTTMINGLGVLGWGVGGIEAEAAMLGQPISMLIPQVVGFKLTGKLAEGATATDLVLTVTQMLRDKGVVGKFVEFFGDGLDELPLADRATIANMAPEYGATCGIFPIDDETLAYLRLTGRSDSQVALVEAYAKEQGLFREPGAYQADYTDTLELDMGDIEPSLAGPKRPQDRISLKSAKSSYASALSTLLEQRGSGGTAVATAAPQIRIKGAEYELPHGSVVIAARSTTAGTPVKSCMRTRAGR